MKLFRFVFFGFVFLYSYQAWSYSEACQLVAQMAGNKEYKQQPFRVATMEQPEAIPKDWGLSLIEQHGAWSIYQTDQAWFTKQSCAPLVKKATNSNYKVEFIPVLLNKTTGSNAVITGTFIIKTYKTRDLEKVIQRYHFKMLSPLPNPQSAIVDVKPVESYDLLIRALDRDKDVALAMPLLSEPRRRR
jgi:hypothetical protein